MGQSFLAMESLAVERLDAYGLTAPPINVYAALAGEGIPIDLVPFTNYSLAGCYMNEPAVGASIALNESHNAYKRRFTAAHEYKHHLRDHQVGQLHCLDTRDEKRRKVERDANAFAARFLVPTELLKKSVRELGGLMSVYALAELYGVHYPTLVYRLHNTNQISATVRDHLLSPTGNAAERATWLNLKKTLAQPRGTTLRYLRLALAPTASTAAHCPSCNAIRIDAGPCWSCGAHESGHLAAD